MGMRHWALVAAGCAAVVGGALGSTSATGAVTPAGGAVAQPAAAPPVDVTKVALPMDCGPFLVATSLKAAATVGGSALTVVAAHCQADMGTPPDAVFLLRADSPKPVQLLRDADGYTLTELVIRSDGSIRGKARGYSSDDVPRFAPDVQVELVWTRSGDTWTKTETRTPVHAV
ncbi:hypothetical protein ACIQBJ_29485 [Kitasatospora sp. NPDC088391]|uniref:hypothetical protein n=1 Tax=Kitasatospora sp. NPDC088391 TaxID=3364074 RepID=UPI00381A5878